MSRDMKKCAPVQSDMHSSDGRPGTVSWEVHEKAWLAYKAAGCGSQSAERIAERGGFGYHELQCLLAGHCTLRCYVEHDPVPTWEPKETPRRTING